MSYEHTDDPRDPLEMALASVMAADDELTSICLGELDTLDRARLYRARNALLAALTRINYIEIATRPPTE